MSRDSQPSEVLRGKTRLFLELSGVSQRELAAQTGVPQATLSRFLGGAPLSAVHVAQLEEGLQQSSLSTRPGTDPITSNEVLWACRHVAAMRDTDALPRPPEFALLRTTPVPVLSALGSVDLAAHVPRTPRVAVAPKAAGGFRTVTQLDPLDTLLYAGAIHAIAPTLEASRASPLEVFSYRAAASDDGLLWRADVGWSGFVERGKELAAQAGHEYVLVADISDFYSQIAIHTVVEALEDAGVADRRAHSIGKLLTGFAGRRERGLPIGPHPSALLAEIVLGRVDEHLHRIGSPFVRYVDDFRVFCHTPREAMAAWHELARFLPERLGLSLNDAKTSIIPAEAFIESESQALYDDPQEGTLAEPDGSDLHALHSIFGEMLCQMHKSELREALDLERGASVRRLRRVLRKALPTSLDEVLLERENLVRMVPVLRELCLYLLKPRPADTGPEMGLALLWLATESEWADVAFVQLWIAEVLATRFFGAMGSELDAFLARCKPQIGLGAAATLAVARGDREWVRSWEREWDNLGAWDRRAVLAATRILADRERDRWASRAEGTHDPLLVALGHQVRTSRVPPEPV